MRLIEDDLRLQRASLVQQILPAGEELGRQTIVALSRRDEPLAAHPLHVRESVDVQLPAGRE